MKIHEDFDVQAAWTATSHVSDIKILYGGELPDDVELHNYHSLADGDLPLFDELKDLAGILRTGEKEGAAFTVVESLGKVIASHDLWVRFTDDDIPEAVAHETNSYVQMNRVGRLKTLAVDGELWSEKPNAAVPLLLGKDHRLGLYRLPTELYVARPKNA